MQRLMGAAIAAWFNGVLNGTHAPDDVTDALGPFSLDGLGPPRQSLAVSLAGWRTSGADAAQLVLPSPGDTGGLRAPASIASQVAASSWAVVVARPKQPALLVLPHSQEADEPMWLRVHPLSIALEGQDDLRTAERQMNQQVREAADEVAELVEGQGRDRLEREITEALQPLDRLPSSLTPRAIDVLTRAARLSCALTAVTAQPASASSIRRLSTSLSAVDRTLRRAMEAAAGPTGHDR